MVCSLNNGAKLYDGLKCLNNAQEASAERVAVITLRPAERTEGRKKVVWTEDTVDNEHMNKKKSKCCCIYEKPRKFDESDSESSDDECEHCFGHVEHKKHRGGAATASEACVEPSATVVLMPPATEPLAILVLQPPATETPATDPPDGAPDDTVDGN